MTQLTSLKEQFETKFKNKIEKNTTDGFTIKLKRKSGNSDLDITKYYD